MANPISSDNFPTQNSVKERKLDTHLDDRRPAQAAAEPPRAAPDRTDVDRAHKRLSQEIEGARAPAIESMEHARRQIARLRAQIAADPQAAAKAHGQADANLFEAAMARPTI